MALLGAQLVITLVMVSIIQKFSSEFSFAKWLLCSTGLVRYLHPTNEQLMSLAGVPKTKTKNKNHSKEKSNTFHVPRSLDIELETAKVTQIDIVQLRYFTEYQWLVDFSIYAAIVYVISEIYHFYFPLKSEVNLSLVWCLLVIFFALKLLISLTVLYFRSDESIGERSMCIVACLVYLLIAMIVLIIDENILETGLEEAYNTFNHRATLFLNEQGISSSGPASKIVLKFFLAICCGILGSLFTFPGIRISKMHWDSLKYAQERRGLYMLLNTSFIMPFLLVLLWVKPISRNYLTQHVFGNMEKPLMSEQSFETLRLLVIVVVIILRFSLLPVYLQSYLNIAYDRMESLKKEGGRITNVELQRRISSIFYYLCVVTLQFVAPLIICTFLTLMYKSLSGFQWTQIFSNCIIETSVPVNTTTLHSDNTSDLNDETLEQVDILTSVKNLQASWYSLKQVFSVEVYRGFLGFSVWWSYFTLYMSSAFGLLYQSYFSKE